MLDGLEFEYGSLKERVAMLAKQKLNRIRNLEMILLSRGLGTVANTIISPNEVRFDELNKTMQNYRETLFPELIVDREDTVKKIKKLILEESKKILKIEVPPGMKRKGRLSKRKT